MYLLDTDILIWILRGKSEIIEKVSKFKDSSTVNISVVSIAEIYKNIFPSEITKTENLINQFLTWDVDTSIAKQAGLYWHQYNKKLKNLSLIDCMIAATAKINDATLVSLNIKHFPMKDIVIYKSSLTL